MVGLKSAGHHGRRVKNNIHVAHGLSSRETDDRRERVGSWAVFDIGGDAMLLFHCFDLRAKHHDPQRESDIKDEGVGLRFPCFEHCNFGIWRRSSGFCRGSESRRNVNHVGIDNERTTSFITKNEVFGRLGTTNQTSPSPTTLNLTPRPQIVTTKPTTSNPRT